MDTIGSRIRECREKCGLTQQQLAAKVNVKRETVNQWESGSRQIKGPDIANLADALFTDCDYLLRGVSSSQLSVYKSIGITGAAISKLQVLRPGLGGFESLDDLILNRSFELFLDTMDSYQAMASVFMARRYFFEKKVLESGIVTAKNSNNISEELLYEFSLRPEFRTSKESVEFIEYGTKKEFALFQLTQAVKCLADVIDKKEEDKWRTSRNAGTRPES